MRHTAKTAIDTAGTLVARPVVRRLGNVAFALVGLTLFALGARAAAANGWPLAGANLGLVAGAGVLFVVAYAFKAYGWHRLFAPHERPRLLPLAFACGAASWMGVALPGRVDDAARVAIVRRFPGCRLGVSRLCLSLVMLGLADTVALAPLASAAAATAEIPVAVRVGLAVVAFAGVGAAVVMLVLPRASGCARVVRFRLGRWLAEHTATPGQAAAASAFVLVSWLVRASGLILLLGALGVGFSFPLAAAFLCAGAACGALPIAPAGAATQAGAGAAVLVAAGLGTSQALSFALASQILGLAAAAFVIVTIGLVHAAPRFVPALGPRVARP
jgi:uncharacterized membrane protein YbhN (UPF0104 family)